MTNNKSKDNNTDIITGIVYVKNTQRVQISNGPDGPLGDSVIANGIVYKESSPTSKPIGTMDLFATTTSTSESTERRLVTIELSFSPEFARKSWISELNTKAPGNKKRPSDINLTGIETYPIGGGILNEPLILGGTAGTGWFTGAEGTAKIAYDASEQLFIYRLRFEIN
jgi:hypothetical protein